MSTGNWLAVAAMFVAGAAIQLTSLTNSDVSWLFVLCEKVLSGQRPYVDFIEANPPMSLFLYMPAVALQHATGIAAEAIEIGLMLLLVALSLAVSGRIMAATGRHDEIGRFVFFAAFVLIILPMLGFAEREHIAFALCLPMLTLMVARADGGKTGLASIAVTGLGAGLTVSIKPQYAVALLLPALYIAAYRRSLNRLFLPEYWVCAAVIAIYGAIVVIGYPDYIHSILPILVDTYREATLPLVELGLRPYVVATILIGLSVPIVAGSAGMRPRALVLLLSALGFLFAYFEQGKGWRYHLYPTLALVYLTFLTVCLPIWIEAVKDVKLPHPTRYARLIVGIMAIAGLTGMAQLLKYHFALSLPLAPVMQAIAPNPKLLAITYDLAIGQPLTRVVGGRWVGTLCSQWITDAALTRRDRPGADAALTARMNAWIERDRAILANDIRRDRPEFILVDREHSDYAAMLQESPELAALFAGYRPEAEASGIDLLVRRDLPSPPRPPGGM